MQRRTFIVTSLAASAAACGSRQPWRVLKEEEARTLEALCACIIPEDRDPGAVRAGVVNYIDTQLDGFYKPLRKTYRGGLAAIDSESVALGGVAFRDVAPEKRTALLEQIASKPEIKPFFDTLVAHAMQGFYGDPRHGGNRDRVSWKMLHVPYPPLRGRRKDSA